MTKVLLLQGSIVHYRVPVYNELAQKVDLTVVYSEGSVPEDVCFKYQYIPTIKKHYKIHKKNIYRLAKNYDVVICMFDFSYLYFRLLDIFPHKYKLIYWGIGVSAGYNERYDENQNIIKKTLGYIKRADAMLFYADYPVQKFAKLGIKKEKLFVANNTVKVLKHKEKNKDCLLFIGSLYKQKKINVLLEAYWIAYQKNSNIPNLILIGEGSERENIEQWIAKYGLNEKITLTGGIYNEEKLVTYFEKAILCISPDQAGLSVLKSMGYGVPYVTHRDAITGGEIFNIKNGINGILMESFDELENIILEASADIGKFLQMGRNAEQYYYENRTIEKMVSGFEQAINYVMKDSRKQGVKRKWIQEDK